MPARAGRGSETVGDARARQGAGAAPRRGAAPELLRELKRVADAAAGPRAEPLAPRAVAADGHPEGELQGDVDARAGAGEVPRALAPRSWAVQLVAGVRVELLKCRTRRARVRGRGRVREERKRRRRLKRELPAEVLGEEAPCDPSEPRAAFCVHPPKARTGPPPPESRTSPYDGDLEAGNAKPAGSQQRRTES